MGLSAVFSLQMNKDNSTRTDMNIKNSNKSNGTDSNRFNDKIVKNMVINCNTVPGMSHLTFLPSTLSKTTKHIMKLIIPIGMFGRNIDLQPKNPIKIPPIAGPRAKPAEIATAYIPNAFPNSWDGKALFTIPNDTDIIIAAANPCNALEMIR